MKRNNICSLPGALQFLLMATCLMYGRAHAQEVAGARGSTYYCQQYTDENGLMQNCVNDMLPDSKGGLWLATQSGVQYFNGSRFFLPENQPSNSGYLNRVWSLYHSGDSIIAQTTARQVIYIHAGKVISRGNVDLAKQPVLQGNAEKIFVEDHSGSLQIDSTISGQVQERKHIHFGKEICRDTFVVAHKRSIAWFSKAGMFRDISFTNDKPLSFVFLKPYTAVFYTSRRIGIYDQKGTLVQEQVLPGSAGMRIIASKDKNVSAYCSVGDNIFRISIDPNTHHLYFDTLLSDFAHASAISAIWQKDPLTIVASSMTQGLFIFRKNLFTTLLAGKPNEKDPVFYAQTLLPDSATIITSNNLLFRDGKYVGSLNTLHGSNSRYAILSDSKKRLWFGSGQYACYTQPPYKDTLRACRINFGPKAFYEAPDGKIWISNDTASDIGYYKDDIFHRVKLKGFAPGWRVESFYTHPQLGTFLATSNGIYLLSEDPQQQGVLLPFLQGQDVRFIEGDKNNNIWIATYGDGYYLYHNQQLTHLPLDAEKRLSYVHAIVAGSEGEFVYFPTNHGLLACSYKDLISYAEHKGPPPSYAIFDRFSGLKSNEFNGGCSPAYLHLPDGTISLPSTMGLVRFDPDSLGSVLKAGTGTLTVEHIWVDGVLQTLSDHIECPAGVQTISFRVNYDNWIRFSGIPVQYAIVNEGMTGEPVWLDVPASGLVTVSGMMHGEHKILLRTTWLVSQAPQQLAVHFGIAPLWYQTKLFYAIVSIIVLGLLFLLNRLRYWSLLRRNKMLEDHVRIATEDIRQANTQLYRNNMLKNRLLSALSHDIATPLQYIERSLSRLAMMPADTPVNKGDIEEVVDTVINLGHLADDLVSWSQLQQNAGSFSVYREPVVLSQLIQEKWKPLRSQAAYKQIGLQLNFDHSYTIHTDPKLLGIIIYNIFTNAIKFSNSGTITVAVQTKNSHCIISITDQGKGFSPQRLQQVNGLLQVKSEKGTDEESGKGIGLRIVRDLVHTMEGTITISSVQHEGTTITVGLPYCF